MGQVSSRLRPQHESSPVQGTNNSYDRENGSGVPLPDTSIFQSSSSLAPQAGPSRPSSVRRSLLSFVKSPRRERSDSNSSSTRKSWRQSRRWSKAPCDVGAAPPPADASDAVPEPLVATSEIPGDAEKVTDLPAGEVPHIGNSHSSAALPTLGSSSSSRLPDPSQEDGEERAEVSHSEGAHSQSIQDFSRAGDGPAEGLSPDLTSASRIALESQPIINGDTASHPSTQGSQNPRQPINSQSIGSQTLPPSGRQFPPPGTLVVVQGVVHTTDVPRPIPPSETSGSASDLPPRSSSAPPANDSTRNRLSTLLRSRPASTIIPSPSPIDSSSSTGLSHIQDSTLQSDSLPNSSLPSAASNPELNLGGGVPIFDPASTDPQPGTISSSSIDVLGTLLSVAAAATAASLLTGTTEPMLPTHVGPPAYNSNMAPVRASEGHAWPSPAAFPSSTGLAHSIGPDPAAAGRAERLRQAWGSIRERLGLRPAPPPPMPASPVTNELEIASPTTAASDPRELVLAQMARAFNLGFGINDGSVTPVNRGPSSEDLQSQDAGSNSEGNSDSPPDGSFERFLVDLQADLRTALTNPNPNPPPDEADAEPFPVQASTTSADINDDSDDVAPETETGDPQDSELEDDTLLASHDQELPAASDQPPVDANVSPRTDVTNPDTNPQGRINWWRLYRFPPIATRLPGGVSIPPVPLSPPPPSSTTLRNPVQPSLPDVMDSTLSELPFAHADANEQEQPQQASQQIVVPVIVVGLQSVNANLAQTPSGEDHGDSDGLGGFDDGAHEEPAADGGHSHSNSGVDAPDVNGRPTRGRAWHSRAAEALRSFRPGRRTRATPAPAAAGSRTFLIYVIGGYYPPDHSIVTGGPNTLDSFEALLELAELLGQVKPPTVTKEDIEKSGLETFKASQLKEYEEAQKIASNCVDRCLICLDDYQPDDNLRLMACRHGFHMTCVDKWLETGRNNCPACRSRGVSVSS